MFVDKSWVFFSNYFSKTNYGNGPKIKGFERVEVLSVLMTKFFQRYQRLVLLGSLAFWPSPVNCGGKHVVTLFGTWSFWKTFTDSFLVGNLRLFPPSPPLLGWPCPVIYNQPEPASLPRHCHHELSTKWNTTPRSSGLWSNTREQWPSFLLPKAHAALITPENAFVKSFSSPEHCCQARGLASLLSGPVFPEI